MISRPVPSDARVAVEGVGCGVGEGRREVSRSGITRAIDEIEGAAYSVAFEATDYGRGFCDGILFCIRVLRRRFVTT
jgi:hypothetical protein